MNNKPWRAQETKHAGTYCSSINEALYSAKAGSIGHELQLKDRDIIYEMKPVMVFAILLGRG